MTENFDTLEWKMPTRVRRRRERAVKTAFEFKENRKFVEFRVFVLRAVSDEFRDFAELKPHHIEQVNRRFVKKSAGDIDIARPDRIFQLAAIHFDMRRMRIVFRQQFFEFSVNRRVAAIVSDLENAVRFVCDVEQFSRVL